LSKELNLSENPVYILCIETANAVTSVAISKDGHCIALKEVLESNKAADTLHVLLNTLMTDSGISFSDLNAISISAGPGSYTGLRIAAAAAKGYCYSLDIPLIPVSTLEAMVNGIQTRYNQQEFDVYVPMIDARRMEVFTSFYNKNLQEVQHFNSLIIDENFKDLLEPEKKYLLFGNGAFKVVTTINVDTTIVFENFRPSAQDLCLLAFSSFIKNNFTDIAYFEPNYAKAFYSTQNLKNNFLT
jgi:tRNA threonylcarbamoyladenosine biosynthesis protein TsaB